jgi:hypothetical protein
LLMFSTVRGGTDKDVKISNSSNVSETWNISSSTSYLKYPPFGILKNGPVLPYF